MYFSRCCPTTFFRSFNVPSFICLKTNITKPAGAVTEMFLLSACVERKSEWLPSVPAEKHIDLIFESFKSLPVGVLVTFFQKLVKTYEDFDQGSATLTAAFNFPLKSDRLSGMK